jgi:hypothetical protein
MGFPGLNAVSVNSDPVLTLWVSNGIHWKFIIYLKFVMCFFLSCDYITTRYLTCQAFLQIGVIFVYLHILSPVFTAKINQIFQGI